MSKSNLEILSDYSIAMINGDSDAVYDFWSDDFISHATQRINPDAVGTDVRAEEKKFWQECQKAFSGFNMSVNCLIEQDDKIVTNWTITGTHDQDDFYGKAPSNQPVEINGTAIIRFENGKIAEHWGGPHCADGIGIKVANPHQL